MSLLIFLPQQTKAQSPKAIPSLNETKDKKNPRRLFPSTSTTRYERDPSRREDHHDPRSGCAVRARLSAEPRFNPRLSSESRVYAMSKALTCDQSRQCIRGRVSGGRGSDYRQLGYFPYLYHGFVPLSTLRHTTLRLHQTYIRWSYLHHHHCWRIFGVRCRSFRCSSSCRHKHLRSRRCRCPVVGMRDKNTSHSCWGFSEERHHHAKSR